jgi:hypothetical protein
MWLRSINERPHQVALLLVPHFNDRFTEELAGVGVTDLGASGVARNLTNSHGHTIREVPMPVCT